MDSFELGAKNLSAFTGQGETAPASAANVHSSSISGIENQLHSAGDIASARNFFAPKVDVPVLGAHVAMPAPEQAAMTAVKAASQAISPMLQIIMNLPGHIGIFNSFMEALKNFLFAHNNLLVHFNPANFGQAINLNHAHTLGLDHAGQSFASGLGHHQVDLSILPQSHIIEALPSQLGNSAHLHASPFASLKSSMNVSAGIDLKHPQFEGQSSSSPAANNSIMDSSTHGLARSAEALAGPGLSNQAITPRLAPAQTIFSSKLFESAAGSQLNSGSALLSNTNPTAATGITSGAANALSSPSSLSMQSHAGNMLNNQSANQTVASQDLSINQSPSPAGTTSDTSIKSGMDKNSALKGDFHGMHAKALSLNDFLHHKGHMSGKTSENPFSKLANKGNQVLPGTGAGSSSAINDSSTSAHSIFHHSFANTSSPHHQSAHQPARSSEQRSVPKKTATVPKNQANLSDNESVSADNVYEIKSGDSLWDIARDHLGDGSRWHEIYNLNADKLGSNPDLIYRGTSISMPDSGQITPNPDGSIIANQSTSGSYTVKAGDNLWRISKNFLGDGQKWPQLYKVNSDLIGSNPRLILPGQKFHMPDGADSSSLLAQSTPASTMHIASATPAASPPVAPASHAHHQTVQSLDQHKIASSSHAPAHHPAIHEKVAPSYAQPQVVAQSNNGLAVGSGNETQLAGPGAAQAEVDGNGSLLTNTATNATAAAKAKSVVSFSLTPDLSFLSQQK